MSERDRDRAEGKGKSTLPWVLVGILLLLVIGGGAYIYIDSRTSAAGAQANQGRVMQQNPALQAAMEIMRLQRDPQMALTSDQTVKAKPILQSLIDTGNPTQDFLKQQADALNNLLNDQQRNFLSSQRNNFRGGNPNGNEGNPNGSGGNPNAGGNNPNGSGGFNRAGGGQNPNGPGRSFQPQDLYKQVLDSLK